MNFNCMVIICIFSVAKVPKLVIKRFNQPKLPAIETNYKVEESQKAVKGF